MDEIASPIQTVLDIGYLVEARILAEVGDCFMSDSPDKVPAYTGLHKIAP